MKVGMLIFAVSGLKSVAIATSFERSRKEGRIYRARLYKYLSLKFGEDRSSTL